MLHPPPELDIVRRRERVDALDNRRLRRALEDGSWTRIVVGAFVRTAEWTALRPIEQHRVRVYEVARRLTSPTVFAYHAAAATWDVDILGPWPLTVDVVSAAAGGGRRGGTVRRHARELATVETLPFIGGHRITTAAQTVLDLARTEDFVHAVAVVDQLLWIDRPGGQMASRDALLDRASADSGRRGDVRARRAIAFSESRAANVRESQSRVVVMQLGFPTPQLQKGLLLPSGREAFADLWFPAQEHWCEIDGRWKYSDPRFLAGRTPAQALLDEKNRENEIRRNVRAFSRWEATDADHPRRIWDILTSAGLPTPIRRP